MREELIRVKDINKIIPVGQKVMVYVEQGNFEGTYSSFIYDMDDEYIYILMPTNQRGLKAVIREGEKISVSFVTARGYRIGFHAPVVERITRGSKTLYKLSKPREVVKVELRENFRVEALVEAEFFYFKDGKIQTGKGTIIDISAGGVKLSCDVELQIGDRLFLKFSLSGNLLEQVEAEVVRRAITGDKDIKHYGLRFVDLDKEKEEKIIKFCINKQMELARRMKGLE